MPPETQKQRAAAKLAQLKRDGKLTLTRQYRSAEFDRSTLDVEKRTVQVSFSSETPVKRWYGNEVLSHAPNAVRMQRLNDSGPLLFNHDFDRHIGVIENARIENGRGTATVRFGNSPLASEKMRDVQDGILRSTSVGYDIHAAQLEEQSGEEDTYRMTDWEPYEISFCPAGADPTVGVGRDAESSAEHVIDIQNHRTHEENAPMPPEKTAAEIEQERVAALTTATNEARGAELSRIREIAAVGKQCGFEADAERFINEGKDAHDFRKFVLDEQAKRRKQVVTPVAAGEGDLGLSENETRRFSFVRALHALANPDNARAQEAAAFEREVSIAAVAKSHREIKGTGFRIPDEVLRRRIIDPANGYDPARAARALNATSFTAGGALVATDLLSSSFIELLRKANILEQLGAMTLSGLVGDVAIPRQTGGATAYWISPEGGDITSETDQALDQVALLPKTLGAYTEYSRQLLMQSSLDVEAFVRMDIAKVIGLELSRVALYGLGDSGQPRGIFATTGIGAQHFAAANVGGVAQPTWGELVAMETAIANANVIMSNPGYALNTAQRGYLKTTPKIGATFPVFLWEPGNEVNGYRTAVSNQVNSADMFFGNWADLIIAMWGGFDLLVDPYAKALAGSIRIVVHQSCDVGVRHPVSFCLGSNTNA